MPTAIVHLAVTWGLILSQFLLCVYGHGRIVICQNGAGLTHIELIHNDNSSVHIQDSCGHNAVEEIEAQSSYCSESPCADKAFVPVHARLTKVNRFLNAGTDFEQLSTPLFYSVPIAWDTGGNLGQYQRRWIGFIRTDSRYLITSTVLIL